MQTAAILPIKSFSEAKQRLAAGLDPATRRALAEAMFCDVLVALRRCHGLGPVLVVTGDPEAHALALSQDARVLADTDDGHNPAAACGIAQALAEGCERVLLVPGDCPLLDPGELEAVLAKATPSPSVLIVPDRHGAGTNALLLTPPEAIAPAFGPGSCARHQDIARRAGVHAEVVEVPGLALDLDTPEDLDALTAALDASRGGAARTRGLLWQLARAGS